MKAALMWRLRWKVRMNARVPSPLSGVRVNVNGANRNWRVCVPVRNVWFAMWCCRKASPCRNWPIVWLPVVGMW